MMNKYDKVFLEQARLGYSDFVLRYQREKQYNDLQVRKQILNREFVFLRLMSKESVL